MTNSAELPPAPTYDGAVSSSPWTTIADILHFIITHLL